MSSGQQTTTAIKVGTTRLHVHHAACDDYPELEGCRGGIADTGTAKIVVQP